MVIEKILKITSEPHKVKSSYGTWAVAADCKFISEESKKEWNYPSKVFYFWSKKRAIEFIDKSVTIG